MFLILLRVGMLLNLCNKIILLLRFLELLKNRRISLFGQHSTLLQNKIFVSKLFFWTNETHTNFQFSIHMSPQFTNSDTAYIRNIHLKRFSTLKNILNIGLKVFSKFNTRKNLVLLFLHRIFVLAFLITSSLSTSLLEVSVLNSKNMISIHFCPLIGFLLVSFTSICFHWFLVVSHWFRFSF